MPLWNGAEGAGLLTAFSEMHELRPLLEDTLHTRPKCQLSYVYDLGFESVLSVWLAESQWELLAAASEAFDSCSARADYLAYHALGKPDLFEWPATPSFTFLSSRSSLSVHP